MKTKELKAMLKVAEQLGHDDIPIVISEGRDGETSYRPASVRFVKESIPSAGENVLLAVY